VQSVDDAQRPGQANHVVTPECINAISAVTCANKNIKLKELAMKMNMSYGTIQHIVHNELGFHKVCAKRIPQNVTPGMK
jgi:hypothetical protein